MAYIHLPQLHDDTLTEIVFEAGGGVTYTGQSMVENADKTLPIWRVIKEVKIGNTTNISVACDGDYKGIWNDRTTYFVDPPAPAYANTNSISFDGADEYINFGDSIDLPIGSPATVAGWVKLSSNNAHRTIVAKKLTGATNFGWWLFCASGTGKPRFGFRTSSTSVVQAEANYSLPLDTWVHIAVTYSGSADVAGINFYIDGALQAKTTINDTYSSGDSISNSLLTIGAFSGTTHYFDGKIDELAVWSAELAAADVSDIYGGGVPSDLTLKTAAGDLTAWWRCGDLDTFPNISDTVGNTDGVMTNMDSANITTDVP